MKYIEKILDSGKTVFRYDDLALLLWISNRYTLKNIFQRGSDEGVFVLLQKWIYTLKKYNSYELGCKLKSTSYISFETVLKSAGIIFQDYGENIFLASDNNLEKKIDGKNYLYKKIKNDILLNPLWIIQKQYYCVASPERAVCDRIYLSKNYHFDNLENIDYELLQQISQIYNKRVILQVTYLIKHAEQRKI